MAANFFTSYYSYNGSLYNITFGFGKFAFIQVFWLHGFLHLCYIVLKPRIFEIRVNMQGVDLHILATLNTN